MSTHTPQRPLDPTLVANAKSHRIEDIVRGMALSGWAVTHTVDIDPDDPEDVAEELLSIKWTGWTPYAPRVDILIFEPLNDELPQDTELYGDYSPWNWATRADEYKPGIQLYAYFRDLEDEGMARLIDLDKLLAHRGDHIIADDFQVIIPIGDLDGDEGDDDDDDGEDLLEPDIRPFPSSQ